MRIAVRVQFSRETTVVVRIRVVTVRVFCLVVTRLGVLGAGGVTVTRETSVVVAVAVTVSSARSVPAEEAMTEDSRANRPSNFNSAMTFGQEVSER